MTTTMLTTEEIYTLTGYSQRAAQRRALNTLGIISKPRPSDGFPVVSRIHFEEVMGFGLSKKTEKVELNL